MKHLFSLCIAVLVAFTAFGQSTPTNKVRSNDSFTQVDNYLVAAKRLGIPSGPTPTLDASVSSANSTKLFYDTDDEALMVYDPVSEEWSAVSVDLTDYWTIAQVDSAIAAKPTPTLQEVAAAGNGTTYAIDINGFSGSSGIARMRLVAPPNYRDITMFDEGTSHISGKLRNIPGSYSSSEYTARTILLSQSSGVSLSSALILTPTNGVDREAASIRRGENPTSPLGRISAAPALNEQDLVTLGQLNDSLANAGGGEWGTITGTLSDQTDLQDALDSKLDTAAHGFGLSWNPATQKMDWGTYTDLGGGNALHWLEVGSGNAISIGDPNADAASIFVSGIATPSVMMYTGNTGATFGISADGARFRATTASPEGVDYDATSNTMEYVSDYSANYTNRSLVDKAYVDNQSAFNVMDVTQALYTDKAINVRAFNNTGMTYSEGSIDFGITRDSTHTMGLYAFKQGVETTASSLYSSAFGVNTTASDIASSAFGGETTASGPYSSAFGNNTTASGYASSAFGAQTTASGYASSAFGLGNAANEYASLAIGQYSTDGAVETSWTAGSPIFKVGNGVNDTNRSNAYVLYNDGRSEQEKDVEVTEIGQGFVLKSPNGSRWRITVDNSGNLTTTAL